MSVPCMCHECQLRDLRAHIREVERRLDEIEGGRMVRSRLASLGYVEAVDWHTHGFTGGCTGGEVSVCECAGGEVSLPEGT